MGACLTWFVSPKSQEVIRRSRFMNSSPCPLPHTQDCSFEIEFTSLIICLLTVCRVMQLSPQWIQNTHRPSLAVTLYFSSAYLLQPHRQPLISFLSQQIYLFWTFHINGITEDVIFCDWLLSFIIIFSRFIHAVACISTSFLFLVKRYSVAGLPQWLRG